MRPDPEKNEAFFTSCERSEQKKMANNGGQRRKDILKINTREESHKHGNYAMRVQNEDHNFRGFGGSAPDKQGSIWPSGTNEDKPPPSSLVSLINLIYL